MRNCEFLKKFLLIAISATARCVDVLTTDQIHNQPVDEREIKSEKMRIKPNQRTGRQASERTSSKVFGSIFIYPINRDHFYQTVEPSKEQRKEIFTKSVVSSVKRALTLLLHCVFISNLSHGKDKKSSVSAYTV